MRIPSSSSVRGCSLALAFLLGVGACGMERLSKSKSPFALFGRDDMRAGLPYDVMVQTAKKESSQPLECLPLWARAKRCAVRIEHGILAAVVDSTDRIIRLIVTLDDAVVGGQNPYGQHIMKSALDEMKGEWSAIGPNSRETGEETTPQRRWLAPGGRWGAALWFPPPRGLPGATQAGRSEVDLAIALPDSFGVTDLPAYSLLLLLRPPERSPRPRSAVVPPAPQAPLTPEQLLVSMRSDLRELTIKQEGVMHGTGRYETSLEHLQIASATGVRFALVNPTPEGWSAIATHPSLPGISCVVFAGIVDARPRTRKSGLTGAPGEVVCDSL